MKTTTNIGICGPDSIRIGGMKIGDLPIRESAVSAQQMPLAEDTDRQNKIKDIMVASPTQRVTYLESRIVESQANIVRISEMKSQQQQMISEYTSQISLCEFRDGEVARIAEDEPDRDTIIKDLKKRFPPYNVAAMKQQIVQSTEAIERADGVISQEYNSIAELRELLVLCQARDTRLRNLGAAMMVG